MSLPGGISLGMTPILMKLNYLALLYSSKVSLQLHTALPPTRPECLLPERGHR